MDKDTISPLLNRIKLIQPASQAQSRVSDLSRLQNDLANHYDDEELLEDSSNLIQNKTHSPTSFRRFKKKYCETTDKTPEMVTTTFKAFISGIPNGYKERHVYYNLLVYLSQFELMLVSDLDFVDDETEHTSAVMILLEATEEARHYLQAYYNTLELDIFAVLQIPDTIKLFTTVLKLTAYEISA